MPFAPELDKIISSLVDGWCERRELQPLGIVLPAWPSSIGQPLTDEWEELRAALRHARAIAKERMTEAEREQLNSAIALVDIALRRDGD